MFKFKVGDEVLVSAGKDKGKKGKIGKIFPKESKVLIESINIIKKHKKVSKGQSSGIYEISRPVSVAKVSLICPKCGKQTRIGFIIEKITVNVGVADALINKDVIGKVTEQISLISGQKPKWTKAKKAIAGFKLRQGDVIGVKVTLRGKKAWQFLERLIRVAIPRIRDFRGISQSKFDKDGNYTLGLTEQIIFPEIVYSKIDKIRGLSVTISIKNTNPEKSKRVLELLGLPFKNE